MDREDFYRVLGLPKGASKEDATKMYNLLKDRYSALIKEGKLEPEKLNELNMAYLFVTTDKTEEVLKYIKSRFIQNKNIMMRLLSLKNILSTLASEYNINSVTGIFLNIISDYTSSLNAFLKKLVFVNEVDDLIELFTEYRKLEDNFLKKFLLDENNLGRYYNYCLNYMAYGLMDTKEVLLFNASLNKCHSIEELLEVIKNNMSLIIKISNLNEEMKRLYYHGSLKGETLEFYTSLDKCLNEEEVLKLVSKNLDLVKNSNGLDSKMNSTDDSLGDYDEEMQRLIRSKVRSIISGEVVNNNYSIDDLANFYRTGRAVSLRDEVIKSLRDLHKLKKNK